MFQSEFESLSVTKVYAFSQYTKLFLNIEQCNIDFGIISKNNSSLSNGQCEEPTHPEVEFIHCEITYAVMVQKAPYNP